MNGTRWPVEWALIAQLHTTGEDIPRDATIIDATAPLARVVDELLSTCGKASR